MFVKCESIIHVMFINLWQGLGINCSAVYCTVDSVIQFSQPLTVTDSQWCYLGSGSVFIFSCGHWPESTSWNAYIYLFLLIIYYESEISNSCSFIHLLLLWICFNSFSSGYKYNTPKRKRKAKAWASASASSLSSIGFVKIS